MTGSELQWATSLLAELGIPGRLPALQALVAVAAGEGSGAWDNPDDTTEPEPGAWRYNGVGVEQYPTWSEGIAATAGTIRNGLYGPVLQALASGTAEQIVLAWSGSPWGTWADQPTAALAVLRTVQANWWAYAARPVAGPGPETPAVTAPTSAPTAPPPGDDMPSAVYDPSTGKVQVFARSTANHLLQFTPDPADPSGWSVIDVTADIAEHYPAAEPYTIAS